MTPIKTNPPKDASELQVFFPNLYKAAKLNKALQEAEDAIISLGFYKSQANRYLTTKFKEEFELIESVKVEIKEGTPEVDESTDLFKLHPSELEAHLAKRNPKP